MCLYISVCMHVYVDMHEYACMCVWVHVYEWYNICVHMCMFVSCMCVYVYECMCVCTCVWMPEVILECHFSEMSSTLFWETGSSHYPRAHCDLDWLVSETKSAFPLFPELVFQVTPPTGFPSVVLGPYLGSSSLHNKHFMKRAVSSAQK